MTQETTYVAKDGRRFYGAGAYDACVKYERELQRVEQGRVDLAKFVRFFDWDGRELTYEQACDDPFCIYYIAYLQPVTENILWTMLEEVSWEVADAIRYGTFPMVTMSGSLGVTMPKSSVTQKPPLMLRERPLRKSKKKEPLLGFLFLTFQKIFDIILLQNKERRKSYDLGTLESLVHNRPVLRRATKL